MKKLFFLLFFPLALLATVSDSIVSLMDQLTLGSLEEKINEIQRLQMYENAPCLARRVRALSFNMLFSRCDDELEEIHRWGARKERVIEYLLFAHPDIIASQELQPEQLADLRSALEGEFDCYSGAFDPKSVGYAALFYRREKLRLIDADSYFFPEKNLFTCVQFEERKTGERFLVVNTHLTFGRVEKRAKEALILRNFLLKQKKFPLLLMGDFNTFPCRQELDLPFYDGDMIVQILEEGKVKDSMSQALYGHFGPISSTNYCTKKQKAFCSLGTPGVILDHIFVNRRISVLAHGIDPAKVNEQFPSDHFPVLIDFLLCK